MKNRLFSILAMSTCILGATAQNIAVERNAQVNQAYISTTAETKYYNTADIKSIDINGSQLTLTSQSDAKESYAAGQVNTLGFIKAGQQTIAITEAKGWLETAYAKWAVLQQADNYNVYVKGPLYADYTKLDDALVRNYGSYARADAVGLTPGNYTLKVVPVKAGKELSELSAETATLEVKPYNREGYAHFNYTAGVGAYKNDGSLKDGARVIYVTKNTAKTVTCNVTTSAKNGPQPYTGLQAIIDAYQKGLDTTPLAIRLIGTIQADDVDKFSSSAEGIQVKGKKADSEMNITIEGIGDDATVKGFGFLVRNCKSVEMRNLAIMQCMDDGISLDTDNSNIWLHHIDVFYGRNKGGDQKKGDGAIDVKSDSKFVTIDYCHFWDTGKSSMCGMKSESGPNYITYHHNWFDHSDSRHARVRTMSVHMYNNYFDNVAKYGVGACNGSSIFMENNYFLKTKKPMLISQQGTDAQGSGTFSGENGGMIKAYGNYLDRTATNFKFYTQKNVASTGYDAYEVSERNEQVPQTEVAKVGATPYNNFDTTPSLIYTYTPDEAEAVPSQVTGQYGAGRMNHGDLSYTFKNNVGNDDTDSAIDTALETLITNYKTSLVGHFTEGY